MNKIFKIALIGPQSTGKTTAAYGLAHQLKSLVIKLPEDILNVAVVSEVARKSPLALNEETTYYNQLWIYHQQFIAEAEALRRNNLIICDRSVLDNLIYTQVKFEGFYPAFFNFEAMEAQVKSYFETYNLVYYFEPQYPPVNDGVRSDSLSFQTKVNKAFLETLNKLNLEYKVFKNIKTIIRDIQSLKERA